MSLEASYRREDERQKFVGDKDGFQIEETDRDAVQEPSDSHLGGLRREIMSVQRQVNNFLTERMQAEKEAANNNKAEELEKKMLDGNDEEAEE